MLIVAPVSGEGVDAGTITGEEVTSGARATGDGVASPERAGLGVEEAAEVTGAGGGVLTPTELDKGAGVTMASPGAGAGVGPDATGIHVSGTPTVVSTGGSVTSMNVETGEGVSPRGGSSNAGTPSPT